MPMPALPVLMVFSHMAWNPGQGRTPQLMAALAGRWQILFVEAPRHAAGAARLESRAIRAGLTVLTLTTPAPAAGFHDDAQAFGVTLLREELAGRRLKIDIAWLDTPMAWPLAQALGIACLAYDCLEGPPASLQFDAALLHQRESALMRTAALMVAAGPSLFNAHRHRHANLHCVCSAVHAEHFSPASLELTSARARRGHVLQSSLARPRLGYFGSIDERLDLDLLAALADRQPGWAFVMVGSVAGIAAERLPQRRNIHWLGEQDDALLPYLLAGWDLALMPYVVSEATRFLMPSQTLEYMAGYQPIVSTPVRDVQALYAPAVTIAAPQAEAFSSACEEVLAESARARSARLIDMARIVARHAWANTADFVHGLLDEVLTSARSNNADSSLALVPRGMEPDVRSASRPGGCGVRA
jgi:hypothetical protein